MALFAYGLTELDQYGIIFLAISLIILVIFIKIEKKVKEPILNFNLINNTRYVIGNYAAMVTYFTTTIAITALSFHLLYILDFEEFNPDSIVLFGLNLIQLLNHWLQLSLLLVQLSVWIDLISLNICWGMDRS